MIIINTTKNTTIAREGAMADTFFARMTGLLGRKTLKKGEALVITKCQSIHMFFMRFAIDVIFIDKNSMTVGLVKSIKPFRMSPYFFKACSAIELEAGTIERTKTLIGDQILFEE